MATGTILKPRLLYYGNKLTETMIDADVDLTAQNIIYGILGTTAYIIFNVAWIKIEVRCSGASIPTLQVRWKYGSSEWTSWSQLVSS